MAKSKHVTLDSQGNIVQGAAQWQKNANKRNYNEKRGVTTSTVEDNNVSYVKKIIPPKPKKTFASKIKDFFRKKI